MYAIWNFGKSRKVRSSKGFINLVRNHGFQTEDKDLANHLATFPAISVKEVESGRNLEDMGMPELHKIAKQHGIRNSFQKTKKWLINAIVGKEEVGENGNNS